jgi:hypothetical protein
MMRWVTTCSWLILTFREALRKNVGRREVVCSRLDTVKSGEATSPGAFTAPDVPWINGATRLTTRNVQLLPQQAQDAAFATKTVCTVKFKP